LLVAVVVEAAEIQILESVNPAVVAVVAVVKLERCLAKIFPKTQF
jgi:hypothetical protein